MNAFLLAAALVLVPEEQPTAGFADTPQLVRLIVHNPTDKQIDADVTTRLFQTTAATVAPVGDTQPWKTLRVLPGQTVIESATLTFPAVRVATRFLVQWGDLGRTTVLVYPADLLRGLSKLAGEQPLAVFDPDNKLKPSLKDARVEFADYEVEVRDSRLALIWSDTKTLPDYVTTRVKKGMAAVWIRPEKSAVAYVVRQDNGAVVVVPQKTMTTLADSPLTQQTLLRFAELALEPEAWRLPQDNQPTERN